MKISPQIKQTTINLIKLLCIDTAWVWLAIYISNVIVLQLPKTISDDWIYLIAYGFIAILCAVIALLKIPVWVIPIGGIYIAALLRVITQYKLFSSDCLDNWWLTENDSSLFRPSPSAANFLFCFHAVIIQIFVVVLVRILEKRVLPVVMDFTSTTKNSQVCTVNNWLRILTGQLLGCILPAILFHFVKVYALFFTHHTERTLKIVLIVLLALPVFTFSLRAWTALLLSFPVTVGLCFLIEYNNALCNAFGITELWGVTKLSSWQSALLLSLIVLGLNVLGILQWKLIKRIFVLRKQPTPA